MNQVVTAVYSNGVLHLTSPVDLEEQEQVEIEIRKVSKPNPRTFDERKRAIEALAAAGLLANQPASYPYPKNPISEEEQERLGKLFAGEKPLSEIIIEEREGR